MADISTEKVEFGIIYFIQSDFQIYFERWYNSKLKDRVKILNEKCKFMKSLNLKS